MLVTANPIPFLKINASICEESITELGEKKYLLNVPLNQLTLRPRLFKRTPLAFL